MTPPTAIPMNLAMWSWVCLSIEPPVERTRHRERCLALVDCAGLDSDAHALDLTELGSDGVDFLVGRALLLLGHLHGINHGGQVADNGFEAFLDLFHMIDQ